MFTVQSETFGLFGSAGLTALTRTLERDHRTVRRVRISVRGAARNLSALLPQPTRMVGATRDGVPRRHLHSAPRRTVVGVQLTVDLGIACSNAGDASPASSRRRAGPE